MTDQDVRIFLKHCTTLGSRLRSTLPKEPEWDKLARKPVPRRGYFPKKRESYIYLFEIQSNQDPQQKYLIEPLDASFSGNRDVIFFDLPPTLEEIWPWQDREEEPDAHISAKIEINVIFRVFVIDPQTGARLLGTTG